MARILRRFFDEPEDAWEPVDEPTVRRIFGQVFDDVEAAMEELASSPYVTTSNAVYAMAEEEPDA